MQIKKCSTPISNFRPPAAEQLPSFWNPRTAPARNKKMAERQPCKTSGVASYHPSP